MPYPASCCWFGIIYDNNSINLVSPQAELNQQQIWPSRWCKQYLTDGVCAELDQLGCENCSRDAHGRSKSPSEAIHKDLCACLGSAWETGIQAAYGKYCNQHEVCQSIYYAVSILDSDASLCARVNKDGISPLWSQSQPQHDMGLNSIVSSHRPKDNAFLK